MKLVIVGGVAGGASAAARARRLDEQAEIVVFERGPDLSFANCGLPYFLGGEITDRSKLLVAPPAMLRDRHRLDIRPRTEVLSIDRANQTVTARDLTDGRTYTETYDRLILAPGASPIRPPMPGIDLPGVFTLRNLEETDQIFAALSHVRQAVVVGGGFIGVEVAEQFVHRGIETTLIELGHQVLSPLDPEMAVPLAQELVRRGVCLQLGQEVAQIQQDETQLRVGLRSGAQLGCQLVLLGIGVRPNNQLAAAAGLELGARGGVKVNAHLQTSDPHIYAVGDVIEVVDFVTGLPAQVPLAGPANRQGRLAADHIFGRVANFRGTQGTAIVRAFGVTAALTGASEKTLVRCGMEYQKLYIHPAHHAGYYPGAESMTIKLLFAPETGRVLGAQAVGGAGVDKRIDVLALAIQAGMSVFDLEEVELGYAPPFGSAKDPVNMLGFVGSGILRGDQPVVQVDQLGAEPHYLLDVRTAREFAAGSIPGAVNIPIEQLRQRLPELPADRPIVAYCQVGMRGYLATRVLVQGGFSASNLSGGYQAYRLFQEARQFAAPESTAPASAAPR